METFLLILVGLLGGYFVGSLHERHRLDETVKQERKWATQEGHLSGVIQERERLNDFVKQERELAREQTLRADRAVDQLVLQSGGTPISALAEAEKEQRKDLDVGHQEDLNEIFAEETGEYQESEEPPE